MPNPGLLPTARERAAADDAITATVRGLDSAGIDVDGQIVATRHAAKAIARIARRRGATRVLMERDNSSRLRRFVEGDLQRQLSRRLGRSVTVDSAA
jgi:nucleotide-binding universal stress UspA family protein